MILDEAALQYWHSRFNYMFFQNELEPAIIIICQHCQEDNDSLGDITEARFIGELEPYVIVFYDDTTAYTEESTILYWLTVLLHEMIHQYCAQNGIIDIDELTGAHTDEFRDEAENHGLTARGYALSEYAANAIKKQMRLADVVTDVARHL